MFRTNNSSGGGLVICLTLTKKLEVKVNDRDMKTLVNKRNPAIKIIADKLLSDSFNYITSFCSVPKSYWTLVEEEENISFADRLKERLSKMSQEEIDKAFEEMGGNNDESPTLEEYLKSAYHSPIETEPVDLEKELDNYMDGYFSECQDGTLLNECGSELQYEDVSKIAKYFYKLGKKGGKI